MLMSWEQKRARRAAQQKASDTRVADALNSKVKPVMQPGARKISVGGVNEQKKI